MILIINFGGQYCHLIARRVRDAGVYSEIVQYDIPAERIKQMDVDGIILSGGPSSVNAPDALLPDDAIFNLGIPILGICYGMQLIGKHFKGIISVSGAKEYGKHLLSLQGNSELLKGLSDNEQVWMSHGDHISKLPEGFSATASTPRCPISAMENKSDNIFAIQFHAEVVHTIHGTQILKNFLFGICKAKRNWKVKNRIDTLVTEIQSQIGNGSVIMGVSGGVDSTAAATLIHKAIGNRLFCVFVDHGLLRKGEADEVSHIFTKQLKFKHFISIDASTIFLQRLKGVTDPERKRTIIGHTFIKVFEQKVSELEQQHPKIRFLGQGTIYPDRVESAQPSNQTAKIKSHHNLTLPKKMKLQVIEPLREFYKDEVRTIGKELNIPSLLLERHPFPGPGLAIRIPGTITIHRLNILREVDAIFIEELHRHKLYHKVWQAFAALLPVKSVGVMGDQRTYEYMATLRAVTSIDAMTADWAKLPESFLEHVSNRIINEVNGVNRVLYDISQKPPATIEYE